MSRPKSTQPTDGEIEILNVLWEAGPLELGGLCEKLRERRAVAKTTVATMLRVMFEKGLVRRSEGGRGALWTPTASRSATARGLVKRLLDRVFHGSAPLLVSHLLEDRRFSVKEREQMLGLLEEARARKGGP